MQDCSTNRGDAEVASSAVGGLFCLKEDLGGGEHSINMKCSSSGSGGSD